VIFVIGGIYLVYRPLFEGDKGASATLVGALWGAGAVLLGNGINRYQENRKKATDLQEKQQNLRTFLMVDIVRIMIQHIKNTTETKKYRNRMEKSQCSLNLNLQQYYPRESGFYEKFAEMLLFLPPKEIDALAIFYNNLELTRKCFDDCINQPIEILSLGRIVNSMRHDCEMAAEVVSLIAPERKIQMPGKDPELFVEMLLKAAGESP